MKNTLFLAALCSTTAMAADYTLSTRSSTLNGEISGYDTVNISVQGSTSNGGAVLVGANKTLSITGNDKVNLTNSSTTMQGGSILVGSSASLNIHNNTGKVNISNNTAGGSGGAISGLQATSPISITNNSGGVEISGNTSEQYGGAICSSGALLIANNGNVSITGNASRPSTYKTSTNSVYGGGGIYLGTQKGSFTIEGNDYVEFRGNYRAKLNTDSSLANVQLNSIFQTTTTQANTISAKTDGKVVFYDAVSCAGNTGVSGASYELNANYSNAAGETVAAKGTIIFSGKYAATDLQQFGSAADLTASLTSTLMASTTLHNGTLSIEDGAMLKTQKFTVADGSGARLTLSNGKLDTTGYLATFGTGSEISAEGVNTITASELSFADNTTITLNLAGASQDSTILTLAGDVEFGGSLTISIEGLNQVADGTYRLLNLGDALADISKITVVGTDASAVTWQQGILSVQVIIPEPATTTLSLLALCSLAARRRRK